MNALLKINLFLTIILMMSSVSVLAQESFLTYFCEARGAPTPALPKHCGMSEVSHEDAAVDFCLERFGGISSVDYIGGNNVVVPRFVCLDFPEITGANFSTDCLARGPARCNSIPPEPPFEIFQYKPFDFYDTSQSSRCGSGFCACEGEQWTAVNSGVIGCIAPDPSKDDPDSCTVGNPCNPATGDKYATEVDFENGVLSFIRYYSTGNLSDYGMGLGWTSNHHSRLVMNQNGDGLKQISSNGRGEPWRRVNNVWEGDADSDILLEQIGTNYKVTMSNNEVENYNQNGLLLSKVDTNGLTTTYQYNDDQQLESVTNHYGHSISFTYDQDLVSTVTDAHGAIYKYQYNEALVGFFPLSHVIYPDATPADDNDNPQREYLYTNITLDASQSMFPLKLIGIIDENGDRFATYTYSHVDGRAMRTNHAQTTNSGGQESFTFRYNQ